MALFNKENEIANDPEVLMWVKSAKNFLNEIVDFPIDDIRLQMIADYILTQELKESKEGIIFDYVVFDKALKSMVGMAQRALIGTEQELIIDVNDYPLSGEQFRTYRIKTSPIQITQPSDEVLDVDKELDIEIIPIILSTEEKQIMTILDEEIGYYEMENNKLDNQLVNNLEQQLDKLTESIYDTLNTSNSESDKIVSAIDNSIDNLNNDTIDVINKLSDTNEKATDKLISSFDETIEELSINTENAMKESQKESTELITEEISHIDESIESLEDTNKSLFNTLYEVVSDSLSVVDQTLQFIGKGIDGIMNTLSQFLHDFFETLLKLITDLLTPDIDEIIKWMERLYSYIYKLDLSKLNKTE